MHRLFLSVFLVVLGLLASPALANRAALEGHVTVSAVASKTQASVGDQIVIAVILDHEEHWHSQADAQQQKLVKNNVAVKDTTIEPAATKGLKFGPIQWPPAVLVSAAALGNPAAQVAVFEGKAIAFLPVVIEAGASGTISVPIEVMYQACDDSVCEFPVTEKLTVEIAIVPPGAAGGGAPADPATFAGFDNSVFPKMLAGTVTAEKPLEFNFFGRTFSISTTGAGLVLLLLLALLGGFLLNLTPCVLPVIPIKIMGLQHSAGTASKRVLLGGVMFFGVVAFWMALGLAIAFVKGFTAANQLFQIPAFTISVGVFVAAMAIGMLGLFTVQLPNWVYAIDPKRESAVGAFLFGVMTAVLATPCTAPFMGTAMAWAAKQPVASLLATFASIGIGMGLPYLILALFPQLVAKVPRTGPASELVKQVMGILMLAVAVFFIGSGVDPLLRLPIDPAIRWHWWIAGGFVALAGLWLVYRTWKITTNTGVRIGWSLVGTALAASGVWLAVMFSSHGPIKWEGYTPERLANHLNSGKVVIVDFTAEWCQNCKVLEHGVLHQSPIVKLFESGNAIAMKVDFTGENAAGSAKLKELNWVGIPLLAIYGPNAKDPLKFDTYTVQTVLDAVAKAK